MNWSGNNMMVIFGMECLLMVAICVSLLNVALRICVIYNINSLIRSKYTKILYMCNLHKFHKKLSYWPQDIYTTIINHIANIFIKLDAGVVDIDDYDMVMDYLRGIAIEGCKRLDIILETEGGYVYDNEIIVKILLHYKHTISIYTHVFKYAMSSGTIMALIGETIHMRDGAFLTSVDPQIDMGSQHNVGQYSVADYIELLNMYQKGITESNKNGINMQVESKYLLTAIDANRLKTQNSNLIRNILKSNNAPPKVIDEIVDKLCSGIFNHSMPFFREDMIGYGIKVEKIDPTIDTIYKFINN